MADELPEKVEALIVAGPLWDETTGKQLETEEDCRRRIAVVAIEKEREQLNRDISANWLAIEESTRELRERLERAQADLALYVQVSSVLDGMTGRAPTSAEWEQIKELAKQVKGGIMLDLAIHEAKESAHD